MTAPPAPPCWKSVIGQKILNNSELSCPYKCSRVYCCCRYILNDSEFFFDRSPRHFESILNLYRTGQLHLMEGVCVEAFSEELAYWGLGQEAYKGEIQCPVLPNQICFLTNHNKFHAANLQLLLLSSNQNTVVHRK